MTDELKRIYDERAAQFAVRRTHETVKSAAMSVFVFKIGSEQYGIDVHDLVEVLPYRGCTPAPDTPALLGLINIRGDIKALFDATRLLEAERTAGPGPASGGYVLMVRGHGDVVGMRVDSIEQIRDLFADELSFATQSQSELNTRHLCGITADNLKIVDVRGLTRSGVAGEDKKEQESA